MATAQDRLKPTILLISPISDGSINYEAQWIGDPITKVKKLGLFDSPKVKGTIVQDLEVKGDLHQLTIYFDGPDHDLKARNFWSSLDAKGTWIVSHPVLSGTLELNLVRAVWENEPVRSQSFTVFTTNWIEPLPESFSVSITEIESTLEFYVEEANESAAAQVVDNVDSTLYEDFNAAVSAASKAVGTIQSNIRKFENLQIIDPRLIAIFSAITSISESFPLDTSALTAQFEDLYDTIGLAQNNAIGAVNNWLAVAGEFTGIYNDDTGTGGRNSAAILEHNLSLVNTQIAKAVTLPGIGTRGNAVELAQTLNDYFDGMITTLDDIAEGFNETKIENQYIAQSASFGDQVNVNRQAILFLLKSSVDLKVERVFTTKVPRAPFEIVLTEFDGFGETIERDGIKIDKNFYDFCNWNKLHGGEILLLPAETEVRVFV